MGVTSIERKPGEGGFETWKVTFDVDVSHVAKADEPGAAPEVDEALEREGIVPLFVPKVRNAWGNELELSVFPCPKADIASAAPYPLGPVKAPHVSDAEVDQNVAQLVAGHGQLAPALGVSMPRMGDTVVIDIQGKAPSGKIDDLTKTNFRYLVGSAALPGKVTTLLLGMRIRETKRCNLSQGWRIHGELGDGGRSRACELRVAVRDILRVKAPKLTDEWVAENMPNAKNVRGLKDIVRKTLRAEAESAQHDELLERAANQLTGRVTSMPPEDAVAEMANSSFEGLLEQVHGGGYTITEYLNSQHTDEQKLRGMLKAQASSELTRLMALDALARDNKLEPGEQDYAQAARTVGKAGIENPQEALEGSFGRVYARQLALRARANEWLLERQGLGRK